MRLMAVELDLSFEAQEDGAESVRFDGDSRGYLNISAFLKPHIRRRHSYSESLYWERMLKRMEKPQEDGKTPRGPWHYRRSSVMLRMMEENAKLEEW